MAKQLDLDTAFIVSIWLEAVFYGFLLCLFTASVYVNIVFKKTQDGHSRIMFTVSVLMFILATMHLSMNCFRLIQGYVIHRDEPGGSLAWLAPLPPWHHIFKDTIYGTQEILGDAIAIYRVYVIWGRNWKPAAPLVAILIGSAVSGYTFIGLYPTETANVFDNRIRRWASTAFATCFILSFLTTALMAFRIWQTDNRSKKYRTGESHLMPIARLLIESAALQLIVEFVLLVLYASDQNAQFILLETVTPIVAITFNAITIRITLNTTEAKSSMGYSSHANSLPPAGPPTTRSIAMQHIKINIERETEAVADGLSLSESFSDRK